ncbi:esterase/lipase superfamily enzyme [Rhodoblastus acidophilus]|uniref:alpha/beta hydrolase n=1 Tax=Rhodoblastus acidophilus TaxID=1074 RepID=UPI00160D1B31|nr:alpha/beta hydrolase [Rhodoblastus acidophilus]MCW2286478.1 esterase/lipase superfamily enzyme [Rhodoblastus acidophilus]MCW2335334.1 esterase/lipase superfamily enzyme [Rhodoblastus acidophilus]
MFARKMAASFAVLSLALAPALSGCSTVSMAEGGSHLGSQMQSSLSNGVSNVGGIFSGGPDAPAYSTRIFVVSTRKGGNHSTELTPGAVARYSLDTITVPPGHEAGDLERPNWGAPDPRRHIAVAEHSELDGREFRNQLAAQISGRVGLARDVLVYVHGFNTSLDDARFREAQLVVDGNFSGVPVLFTWPSKSALLAYGADKESATASRDAYLKMLNEIAATPGVGHVHILAHSMGTWLTMETLREAALSGSPDLNGKLGQVLLAAPDIDLSVFRQQISRLDASKFSVFVSKGDRALQLSAGLQGDRRLGSLDPGSNRDRELIDGLGVSVYDISAFSSGLIGHDNYANAPAVVSQIGATLNKAPADQGQAVIDAGADRSVRPDPKAITTTDLAPVAAEQKPAQ